MGIPATNVVAASPIGTRRLLPARLHQAWPSIATIVKLMKQLRASCPSTIREGGQRGKPGSMVGNGASRGPAWSRHRRIPRLTAAIDRYERTNST